MQVNVHEITRAHSNAFSSEDNGGRRPFVTLYLSDGDSTIALLLHDVGDFDRLIAAATDAREQLAAMVPELAPEDTESSVVNGQDLGAVDPMAEVDA